MARADLLSSALNGSTFAATLNFGAQTDTIEISNYAGGAGSSEPPILSAASGVAAGSTGGVGAVTTDQGDGAIAWVVTQSATQPSVQQIKNGQDHTGADASSSGSISVNFSGTKNTSPAASGLTSDTTYFFHFVHTNSAAQDSNVVSSAAFVTPGIGVGTGGAVAQILHRINKANQRCAPEAIQFGCTVAGASVSEPSGRNMYSETFHDLVYVWDFGDPGAVSDKVVNLPAAWNDFNKGHGKF
ncbi:MAG: hypothetical protein AAF862_06720, partial [Pseudomonadota bacterium]